MVGLDSAGKVSSKALPGPGFLGVALRRRVWPRGHPSGERSTILAVSELIVIMDLALLLFHRPLSYTDYKSEK